MKKLVMFLAVPAGATSAFTSVAQETNAKMESKTEKKSEKKKGTCKESNAT